MLARELMTSRPVTVVPTDKLSLAAEFMRDLRIGCLPVVARPGSLELVGMITDRDIVVRCVAMAHGASCSVGDHMSFGDLQTARTDDDASLVLQKMERAQVRRIPVLGDDGALAGIIAQADLARRLGPREPLKVEEVLEHVSSPGLFPA